MQINIGRNNQQLGAFTVPQVLGGLASGQFLPTDIAWHEGLADWQPLSSLAVLSAAPPSAVVAAAPAPAAKPAFALPAISRPETPPSRVKTWILRLVVFVALLLIAIPTARFIQEKSVQSRSVASAHAVLAACMTHAESHDGSYPPDLATLFKDDTQTRFEYFAAGVKRTDAPDKVILISKAAGRSGERVVGYNDGSVKTVMLPDLPQAK